MKSYSGASRVAARRQYSANDGNFSRSRAALKYYSYGSQAAKIEDKRDDVSLKYYGKFEKIENKRVARGSAAKIFCALIVCLCAILMVFARSKVYDYQLENDALAKQLETAREKTASLNAQNTEKIDIAYIETEAARLNMAKPQSYQIVYIEVPKTDYTINHEASTVIEEEKASVSYKSFIEGIKEAGEVLLTKKSDNS